MRSRLAAGLTLVLLGGSLLQAQEDGRPDLLKKVGIDQRLGEQVPLDLPFRDETGREVRLREYFRPGRPVILTLNYYECPMLCTMILNGLVSSLRTLSFDPGREFEIVTVSINPRETPALAAGKKASYLKDYARAGAAEGWHFLTGEEPAIARLADAVGFRYAWDPEHQQYAHAAGIMVLTPQGKVSRYFYGVEYPRRDLRLGLVESSEGKVGTLADQILLFCFHYDPATGRYGGVAIALMRIGGALMVLVLGVVLFTFWRREARRRAGRAA